MLLLKAEKSGRHILKTATPAFATWRVRATAVGVLDVSPLRPGLTRTQCVCISVRARYTYGPSSTNAAGLPLRAVGCDEWRGSH